MLPAHAEDVLKLFSFPHGNDTPETLWWRTYGDDIVFFVWCSDVFEFATSDVEEIREEDMQLLQQCFDDLNKINHVEYLAELFAARKRNTRPMQYWLEDFIASNSLLELFKRLPEQ